MFAGLVFASRPEAQRRFDDGNCGADSNGCCGDMGLQDIGSSVHDASDAAEESSRHFFLK